MIIFLYGPDDYRRNREKKEFIAEFQRKHSRLGLGCFDLAAESGLREFKNFTKNQSIFEPVKLAVLENVFSAKGGSPPEACSKGASASGGDGPRAHASHGENTETELIAELKPLAGREELTVLVSEREKPTKGFDFLLKKPLPGRMAGILAQKFDYLAGPEWMRFLAKEAEKLGFKLSDSALHFFAEIYKNNTWLAITELQKISFLGKPATAEATAGRPIIEKSDLENLELELTPNFWDLLSGLKRPVLRERLAALTKLFAMNEPAGKIFNIAAYSWPEKLPAMAGYDLAVKSGKMDYEEALLDLVIS